MIMKLGYRARRAERIKKMSRYTRLPLPCLYVVTTKCLSRAMLDGIEPETDETDSEEIRCSGIVGVDDCLGYMGEIITDFNTKRWKIGEDRKTLYIMDDSGEITEAYKVVAFERVE